MSLAFLQIWHWTVVITQIFVSVVAREMRASAFKRVLLLSYSSSHTLGLEFLFSLVSEFLLLCFLLLPAFCLWSSLYLGVLITVLNMPFVFSKLGPQSWMVKSRKYMVKSLKCTILKNQNLENRILQKLRYLFSFFKRWIIWEIHANMTEYFLGSFR